MEQGEIGSWSEVDKIDRVRRAHAQRHVKPPADQSSKGHEKNKKLPAKFTPCSSIIIMALFLNNSMIQIEATACD